MKQKVIAFLRKAFKEAIDFSLEVPENPAHGHYSTNVALRLARELKRPPFEVAREFAERVRSTDTTGFFEKVEIAGPGFINFWISKKTLIGVFREAVKSGIKLDKIRPKKTVVIDYSHPNIAKPMSVAHLRSTIIGQALYNIFSFNGWRAIGDNHLGDWGKQFGVLIAAYKEKPPKTKKVTIEDLFNLYVSYTARMKENPALDELARLETKKLQGGNAENIRIWKQFYKISLDEFEKIYKILGVSFDYYLGESFYKKFLPEIVGDALKRGIAERSEGAVVIPIQGKAPYVIQKSDDAYLYATTDIAAVQYRVKKFKPQLILYVVDNGQSLHFEQLFASVRKLGYVNEEKLVHVKFGLILSHDMKKLSTRAGRHIALEEVIGQAILKAGGVVREKRSDLGMAEQKRIAQAVGIAALKYNDLSQNRQSDITFDWDKMLNLEGNSAPYLMYTYARLRSIVRKARSAKADFKHLESVTDSNLVLRLLQFQDVLEQITQDYFPHHLTDYLYDLAKAANHFYQTEPVLKADTDTREARLAIVESITDTLKVGLNLLGIQTLERM